jgi:hypothetical protein
MTTTKTCHYRGYDIVPTRQWSSWCVGVYPTRADLPPFRGLFCIPWRHDGKTLWPMLSRASIASFRASLAGSLSVLWRDFDLGVFNA